MQFFYLLFVLFNIKSSFSLISFDLTYTIKSTNPIFPGLTPFNFTQTFTSWTQDDLNEYYFKSANTFITNEHFGTHIDAPYHGSNTSWTIELIPFERLVSIQALIVDVSKKSAKIENYQIKIEDLNEDVMKKANGYFVLLFYTGKSSFWPDQETYAGGNTREELKFPGLSAQLASYLVDKYSEKLVGVGIDTLSSKIIFKEIII
jgi:kynurenine formamidase